MQMSPPRSSRPRPAHPQRRTFWRQYGDLLLLALGLVAGGAAFALRVSPTIAAILLSPLAFYLPGAALLAALFSPRAWGGAARAMLAVSLSLAMTAVAGLLLHILNIPLTPDSWFVALAGFTGALLVLALVRRGAWTAATDRSADDETGLDVSIVRRPAPRLYPAQVLMLVAAVGLGVFAFSVARSGFEERPRDGFTQLWMLPTTGDGVQLGLRSEELAPTTYRLTLTQGETTLNTWPEIQLAPGETWEEIVPLPSASAENGRLQAQLTRVDSPQTVYRQVSLNLTSLPPTP